MNMNSGAYRPPSEIWNEAKAAVASGSFTEKQSKIASMSLEEYKEAGAAVASGSFTGAQYNATKKGGYRNSRRNRKMRKSRKSRKNRKSKSKSNRRQ